MRKGRLVAFAAASVTATTLLIWALLPYFFPRDVYHAVDITIEFRNLISFSIVTDMANVRDLVPTRFRFPQTEKYPVSFYVGLCRVNVGGRVYESPLVMVDIHIFLEYCPEVGPARRSGPPLPGTKSHWYNLVLFSNNSELGDFFQSYGFPYTYVQSAYSYVSEGPVNRTLLSMTHPNGSTLLEVSAITPSATHPVLNQPDYYIARYHLRDSHNLTIHHYKIQCPRVSQWEEGLSQANLTIGAGSAIWEALKVEYATNVAIYSAFPLVQMAGKIGWIEWR